MGVCGRIKTKVSMKTLFPPDRIAVLRISSIRPGSKSAMMPSKRSRPVFLARK